MRCSRVEEMQERTVTSEIEIRGKDVFGLARLRCEGCQSRSTRGARWVAFRRRQSV